MGFGLPSSLVRFYLRFLALYLDVPAQISIEELDFGGLVGYRLQLLFPVNPEGYVLYPLFACRAEHENIIGGSHLEVRGYQYLVIFKVYLTLVEQRPVGAISEYAREGL